jgi:chromosome segregation ATPase
VSEPATKEDLDTAVTQLRGELASKRDLEELGSELRAELASKRDLAAVEERFGGMDERLGGVEQRLGGVEQRLGGVEQRLVGMEERLGFQITHAANWVVEQLGKLVKQIDEKYADVPGELAALRRELDEHRSDASLHVRPTRAPPKRVAQGKPKKPRLR